MKNIKLFEEFEMSDDDFKEMEKDLAKLGFNPTIESVDFKVISYYSYFLRGIADSATYRITGRYSGPLNIEASLEIVKFINSIPNSETIPTGNPNEKKIVSKKIGEVLGKVSDFYKERYGQSNYLKFETKLIRFEDVYGYERDESDMGNGPAHIIFNERSFKTKASKNVKAGDYGSCKGEIILNLSGSPKKFIIMGK